jgi:hypothetical protein
MSGHDALPDNRSTQIYKGETYPKPIRAKFQGGQK